MTIREWNRCEQSRGWREPTCQAVNDFVLESAALTRNTFLASPRADRTTTHAQDEAPDPRSVSAAVQGARVDQLLLQPFLSLPRPTLPSPLPQAHDCTRAGNDPSDELHLRGLV